MVGRKNVLNCGGGGGGGGGAGGGGRGLSESCFKYRLDLCVTGTN